MSKKTRWGVLGGGSVAPSHVISLQRTPGVELVGLADADEGARHRAEETFGVTTYASIDALLDDGKPDAVTVALPAPLHLMAARLAAERGVDVLCEKPLARNVAECDEVLEVCARHGVQLGAILNNRGYLQTRWVKQLIDEGRWHPSLVAIQGAMPGTSRAADMVLAVGVHYLDLMRWWLGPPRRVSALSTEQAAAGLIAFDDAVGTFRLTVLGKTGTGVRMDIEGVEGRVTLGRFGIHSSSGDLGAPPEWDPEIEGMTYGAGHATVIREAAEALARGEPFPVSGETGREAVALCEAMTRASDSGSWEQVVA
jgi:predicted dehydrogenase